VLLASAVTFDPFLGDVVSTWSAGGSVCAVPRQSVLSLLGEAIKVRVPWSRMQDSVHL
jgi:hypothetical protein